MFLIAWGLRRFPLAWCLSVLLSALIKNVIDCAWVNVVLHRRRVKFSQSVLNFLFLRKFEEILKSLPLFVLFVDRHLRRLILIIVVAELCEVRRLLLGHLWIWVVRTLSVLFLDLLLAGAGCAGHVAAAVSITVLWVLMLVARSSIEIHSLLLGATRVTIWRAFIGDHRLHWLLICGCGLH